MSVDVIFLEPCFPRNQREFVRALHAAGARVTGIGERPKSALDLLWEASGQFDAARRSKKIRGMQKVHVQRMAFDPFAAVQQSPQLANLRRDRHAQSRSRSLIPEADQRGSSRRGIPSGKNSDPEENIIKSCQKQLVALANRAAETLYTPSHHRQPHLPLPRLAARPCGPHES